MTILKESADNTLRHFSEQIRSWCSDRLRNQPGPFRQVELSDQFICKQELHSAPITLWVNRESFIAGAVLLIPPGSEEESFHIGREIAGILGLPCFFTWGRHEIACWSVSYDPPEREWSYELPHDDISSPAAFKKSFKLLMDQMEMSFYTHQQSIPEASALHLANLVYATYNDLLPMVQQAIQLENRETTEKPLSLSLENRLGHQLMLPLALLAQDLLPGTISVDATTNTLSEAAGGLPETLKKTFTGLNFQAELPKDCLRRYHHYISRVLQLKQEFKSNLNDTAIYLLKELASKLGGRPCRGTESTLERIVINPDHCELDRPPSIEIAGIGILAASALIRHTNTPGAELPQQLPDIMVLKNRLPKHHIVGTLHDTTVPKADENKKLNTLLRLSWPNHKIALPVRTPVWVWQLLHLCGLLEKESRIELTIPKDWLWQRYGENIPGTLAGKVTFTKIFADGDKMLHCTILPVSATPATVVLAAGCERAIPVADAKFLRSQILIAMNMPDEIFNLLSTGDLHYCTAEEIEGMSRDGLSHYIQSTLGKHLWNLLAPGKPLPHPDKMPTELARIGVPLPGERIVTALGTLQRADRLSINDVDQELAVWLGTTAELGKISRQQVKSPKGIPDEEQLNIFQGACEKEEIPIFPENYLYEIPVDERETFSYHGRLKIIDTFFDETIMQDRKKQQFAVKGTPQKDALLLISTARSGTVEFPVDQKAMTDILDRYVRDLKMLRQNYYQLAVTYLPEEDVLGKVEEVWKSNSLPDWQLVKER